MKFREGVTFNERKPRHRSRSRPVIVQVALALVLLVSWADVVPSCFDRGESGVLHASSKGSNFPCLHSRHPSKGPTCGSH